MAERPCSELARVSPWNGSSTNGRKPNDAPVSVTTSRWPEVRGSDANLGFCQYALLPQKKMEPEPKNGLDMDGLTLITFDYPKKFVATGEL